MFQHTFLEATLTEKCAGTFLTREIRMDTKYGIIGFILLIVGIVIFVREIKKAPSTKSVFEKVLGFTSALLAGNYLSFAVLLMAGGILFLFYSFGFFR